MGGLHTARILQELPKALESLRFCVVFNVGALHFNLPICRDHMDIYMERAHVWDVAMSGSIGAGKGEGSVTKLVDKLMTQTQIGS